MEELNALIGKKDDDLEKELGFTHYIEQKDILSGKQNHADAMKALLEFAGDQELKVVKTDDGLIVDIFDMPRKEIELNLGLLSDNKGVFWDVETEMCYALLGNNFFSYVFPNTIMFSANEENAYRMAAILQKYKLDFFEPYEIRRFERKKVKLGKNEPCHCGSGKKYKRCCLDYDVVKYGRAIKV